MTNQNAFSVAVRSTGLAVLTHFRVMFCALLIATAGVLSEVNAAGQEQAKPQAAAPVKPKKKFGLRITKGDITGVSLKAYKARITEIASDLSKQLGVPVSLGTTVAKEAITVEFLDLPLEPALRLLAPRVYVDQEIRADAQPKLLGVYLLGYGDPEPAKNAVVQGSSEAMLIEGNTEDTGEQTEANHDDDPLQVDLEDDHLTIKSKKQPLAAVLLTIGELLGVPVEMKYDSDEIVDTVIKDTPFEDAIPRLSQNIRLYIRADLTSSQKKPLRLAVVRPAKPADSAMNH
jgi:hypothetical protein